MTRKPALERRSGSFSIMRRRIDDLRTKDLLPTYDVNVIVRGDFFVQSHSDRRRMVGLCCGADGEKGRSGSAAAGEDRSAAGAWKRRRDHAQQRTIHSRRGEYSDGGGRSVQDNRQLLQAYKHRLSGAQACQPLRCDAGRAACEAAAQRKGSGPQIHGESRRCHRAQK